MKKLLKSIPLVVLFLLLISVLATEAQADTDPAMPQTDIETPIDGDATNVGAPDQGKPVEKPNKTENEKEKAKEEYINQPLPETNEELYKRYKDHSFELMTSEIEGSLTSKIGQQIGVGLKSIFWGIALFFGRATMTLAEFTYAVDITSSLRDFVKVLTESLAVSMTSVAGSIIAAFAVIVLVYRYAMTGKVWAAVRVFGLAVIIFTCLSALKSYSSEALDFIDNTGDTIEYALLKASPTLDAEGKIVVEDNTAQPAPPTTGKTNEELNAEASEAPLKKSATILAANNFKNNLFIPYLEMQYGTANVSKIQEKKLEIDGEEYDRIAGLLDNEGKQPFLEAATTYELDTLENKTVTPSKAMGVAGNSLLFSIVGFFQVIILFIGVILKNIFAFFCYFILPAFVIVLIISLFKSDGSVLIQYGKSAGTLVFMKAGVFFLLLMYSTIISFGFQSTAGKSGIGRFFMMLLFIFLPVFFYYFRYFFIAAVKGDLRGAMQEARSVKMRRDIAKSRKLAQADAKERKQQQERDRQKEEAEKRKQEEASSSPKDAKEKRELSKERNQDRDRQQNEDKKETGTDDQEQTKQAKTKESLSEDRQASSRQEAPDKENEQTASGENQQNPKEAKETAGVSGERKGASRENEAAENSATKNDPNAGKANQRNEQAKERQAKYRSKQQEQKDKSAATSEGKKGAESPEKSIDKKKQPAANEPANKQNPNEAGKTPAAERGSIGRTSGAKQSSDQTKSERAAARELMVKRAERSGGLEIQSGLGNYNQVPKSSAENIGAMAAYTRHIPKRANEQSRATVKYIQRGRNRVAQEIKQDPAVQAVGRGIQGVRQFGTDMKQGYADQTSAHERARADRWDKRGFSEENPSRKNPKPLPKNSFKRTK